MRHLRRLFALIGGRRLPPCFITHCECASHKLAVRVLAVSFNQHSFYSRWVQPSLKAVFRHGTQHHQGYAAPSGEIALRRDLPSQPLKEAQVGMFHRRCLWQVLTHPSKSAKSCERFCSACMCQANRTHEDLCILYKFTKQTLCRLQGTSVDSESCEVIFWLQQKGNSDYA